MVKPFCNCIWVVSLLGIGSAINPVLADTVMGTATAEVMHSVSIGAISGGAGELNGDSLTFGTFAGSAGGTVDIDPSTCTLDASVAHFGGHGCAKFKINGYENATYVISYEPNQTLTHAEMPTATMPYILELDNGDNRNRKLNGGSDEIQFGGSLNVSPDSPAGVYTDTFNITINYQ